ncbi:magnesium transporter MRS2-B-like [Triticum urartu]|uniref:magnesium transporter MRS2-B-like n=1 Tax=Triticum urartu TaxID=4572 RepID=UPI0020438527|nr:magnesium transporter MRS2-B-like [Triticum urartu]
MVFGSTLIQHAARDLRLLDPLFVYPSIVLGRERAIVVNLKQIRCVITADEVLLLNSLDNYVFQYATELQRRLLQRAEGDELLFEFRTLELALEVACSFLDACPGTNTIHALHSLLRLPPLKSLVVESRPEDWQAIVSAFERTPKIYNILDDAIILVMKQRYLLVQAKKWLGNLFGFD